MLKIARILNKILKFIIWLIFITMLTMYICSFLWFKIGMSEYPTLFGYIGINANFESEILDIEKGDLVIAKEYLYDSRPNKHDIVIYKHNGEYNIDAIIGTEIEEKSIKYITRGDESLFKNDILGEVIITFNHIGDMYDILISPVTVILVLGIICILSIIKRIIKSISYKKKSDNDIIGTINEEDKIDETNSEEKTEEEEELREAIAIDKGDEDDGNVDFSVSTSDEHIYSLDNEDEAQETTSIDSLKNDSVEKVDIEEVKEVEETKEITTEKCDLVPTAIDKEEVQDTSRENHSNKNKAKRKRKKHKKKKKKKGTPKKGKK